MPVKVVKKERETTQNLLHRFTKTVRGSGMLLQVRGNQFHKRAKSALVKKRGALRRERMKIEKVMADKLAKPKQ